MMLNDASKMGKYKDEIQKNFRMWVEILNELDTQSYEFKYAYDMFRSHVDHFRYLELSNEVQKPLPQTPINSSFCC